MWKTSPARCGAGLGVAAMAGIGAAIAAVWAAAGVYLGGVFRRHSAEAADKVPRDTPIVARSAA